MARKESEEPVKVPLDEVPGTGRQKLNYFAVQEPVTLEQDSAFNILPGPNGHGWVLTIIKRELPK